MKKHVNKRNLRTSIGLHTLLTVLSVLWMLPVFWLLLSSFRKEPGAYTPYLWPKGFTFDDYTRLFTDTRLFNFPRWFMNTLFVAICCCVLTTILTLMVAYVYSRLRFKSRKAIMNISLILGMFPGFMSMIAIYHFMKAIGLDQTLARRNGMLSMFEEEELSFTTLYGDSSYESGIDLAEKAISQNPLPDIILCTNNYIAMACLQVARHKGLDIPDTVAIMTFDNYPFSMLVQPQLTAVEADMYDMGQEAARFILRKVKVPELQTQSYCTIPRIVEREST